jgi:hypothetical protein
MIETDIFKDLKDVSHQEMDFISFEGLMQELTGTTFETLSKDFAEEIIEND